VIKYTDNMTEINEKFIKRISLTLGTCVWDFETKVDDIVPETKTHEYLLSHTIIDDNICKFYYLPTNRFFSDEDYQNMVETGYVGIKEYTLNPYPFKILGAYFFRNDLTCKLYSIIGYYEQKDLFLENKKIKNLEDLIPYFKEYTKGFKDGYNEFENRQITPYLPMFPDKDDFTIKVFEYVTKKVNFEHSWYNNHSSFSYSSSETLKEGKIINAFKDGQKQGYFYKAWVNILSNNSLFAPLFKEYFDNLKREFDKTLFFNNEVRTNDDELNKLIKEAKDRFLNLNDKQIAVEKLWDAFERVKTYFESNKKESSKKLVNMISNNFDSKVIDDEFKLLTNIGNEYRIRHHETDKKEIPDKKHLNYLFFRMLSLIDLSLNAINDNELN